MNVIVTNPFDELDPAVFVWFVPVLYDVPPSALEFGVLFELPPWAPPPPPPASQAPPPPPKSSATS